MADPLDQPLPAGAPAQADAGLLLFAHGARDPLWARPFEAVLQRCAHQLGSQRVQLAFLEFMPPDLLSAGAQLAAAGCRRVCVLPLFLGAGGHVRKDLPLLLQALRERHADVDWQLAPAIGESPALVQAMAELALAELDSACNASGDTACLPATPEPAP